MSSDGTTEFEFFDSSGQSLGVQSVLNAWFDKMLGQSALLMGGKIKKAASALARRSSFGEKWEWTRVVFDNPLALKALVDEKRRSHKDLYSLVEYSLKLMPDYGGAAVWSPDGACDDFKSHIESNSVQPEALALAKAVEDWQLHFELFCDPSVEYAASMDWKPFMSMGACLCLRSRSIPGLARPLHLDAPFEHVRHDARKPGAIGSIYHQNDFDQLWYPHWGAHASPSEAAANLALEKLDEEDFVLELGFGARQPLGQRPMPWAVFCAHHGLGKALSALYALDTQSLGERCAWGCSVEEASLRGAFALGLELACKTTQTQPSLDPGSKKAVDRLCESMAWQPEFNVRQTLDAWARLGGDLSFDGSAKNMRDMKYAEFLNLAGKLGESMKTKVMLSQWVCEPDQEVKASKKSL